MKLNYRKDIDGIRALAVLSVVFFHAFPKLIPGGYIGVDIFFVLSGYLISNIIFHQVENKQFSWTAFYINRINRIFPALIVILISALISGYFLLFSDEYQNLNKHILGSTFFLNNIMLWKESGYFDVTSDFKPLLHLWSLGIEEQFYLVWPLIIVLIWHKNLKPFSTLLIIIFISFLINILGAAHHGIATFYLPGSRFWELGLGGIIAYTSSFYARDPNRISTPKNHYNILFNVLSILSIITLLIGIFYFKSTFIYPGWAALLPTLCTGILLCTPTSWVNSKLLTKPFLTFIGIISYPLYLWHWELLSFARIVLSGALSNLLTIVLLIISFCLAWLTYRFVEKPIRFSLKGKKYAPVTANILGLSLLSIGGVAFMIYEQHGLESRNIAQVKKLFYKDIENFEHYRNNVFPCEVANQKAKNLGWCTQTQKGTPNKVIWGDSHADHLLPGLIKNAPHDNWLLLGQSSCPPLLNVQGFWTGFKDTCVKANKIALQTILKSPSIDTVVLASLGPFYISDQGYAADHIGKYAPSGFILRSEKNPNAVKNKADVFYEGLDLTIQQLLKSGKKIILFQDIPEIPFMPTLCLHRPLAPNRPCLIKKNDVLIRQKEYKEILSKLKVKYPEILVFNPMEYMCNKQNCQITYKHHLLYRDSHHLSIAGSQYIGNKLVHWIKQQPERIS
jgi:peptidoglycan/LPS O-acetylase OafA/YrhL